MRRPGSPVAASPVSTSAPFTTGSEGRRPLSTARSESRPPHKSDGSIKTTFLTGPPTPAIFALASEVAGNGNGGPPALAAMVLLLLGLTALTLAGPGLVPRPRSARVKRRAPSSKRPRADRVVSANGAPGRAVTTPEHPEALDVLLRESVALFEPIPLAVLDQHATLATRSERKFILDARTFGRLVGELSPHYLILEIDDARVFPYDTIYFDTPELTTYRQHLQGRRRRFKCRSRLYAASDLCFFEIKLKGRRGETIKRRLPLEVEEHGSLTGPALAFLESELDQAYGVCPPAVLGPVLRTSYRRLTLAGRRDSERVTFDFELMFAADGMECSIQPGRILVETKVDNGEAGWEVKRVLRRLGVRPVQTCSKYCLGVTLTHPEVPNNPFRPLIRQHFDGSRHARTRIYEPRQVEPAVELEGEWQPVAPMLPSWQEGTA